MYMALRYSTVAFTFCLLANKITYLHIIQKHHSSFFFFHICGELTNGDYLKSPVFLLLSAATSEICLCVGC